MQDLRIPEKVVDLNSTRALSRKDTPFPVDLTNPRRHETIPSVEMVRKETCQLLAEAALVLVAAAMMGGGGDQS
jgi:hypothetical protein